MFPHCLRSRQFPMTRGRANSIRHGVTGLIIGHLVTPVRDGEEMRRVVNVIMNANLPAVPGHLTNARWEDLVVHNGLVQPTLGGRCGRHQVPIERVCMLQVTFHNAQLQRIAEQTC
jgi:hypothetical protein